MPKYFIVDTVDDESRLCRNRKTTRNITERARLLRSSETVAEQALWACLRNNRLGWKFRRQHAIGYVILDFYCANLRLGIEVDGGIHRIRSVRDYDEYKAELLTGQGITLLRFTNEEIANDITVVLERIRQVAQGLEPSRALTPGPSPRGEGK